MVMGKDQETQFRGKARGRQWESCKRRGFLAKRHRSKKRLGHPGNILIESKENEKLLHGWGWNRVFGDLTATGLICPIRQEGNIRKRELRRDFYMFYYKISISLAITVNLTKSFWSRIVILNIFLYQNFRILFTLGALISSDVKFLWFYN